MPIPHPGILLTVLLLFWCSNQAVASADQSNDKNDDPKRPRDHIEQILLGELDGNHYSSSARQGRTERHSSNEQLFREKEEIVLRQLRDIYHKTIRPVENQFHYSDLKRHVLTDADINAKPIVLMVGPWSTGKSTIINYMLGIEGSIQGLHVGAEPTTADFTVITHGDEYRTVEGIVLATDVTKPFSSMEKFGQVFLEHLLGIEMPRSILRNITFIDTPGILENRRQQERGYPYNDVLRWLVQRADLIFVVFDPTKLDVGTELESLFLQLKGKEAALRIILNKADSMSEQELMRVYGALYWSLAPLINVTEPPRIYVGSFWSKNYQASEVKGLLVREENSLLKDMREVIRNQVQNKIAFIRQQAIRVRIHALLTDSYIAAYRRNKGFFSGGDELAEDVSMNPDRYNVYKTVLSHPNVSEYDLPKPEEYLEFFQINQISEMKRVSDYCGWGGRGCSLENLNQAIGHQLPQLLQTFQLEALGRPMHKQTQCHEKSGSCQDGGKTEQWAKDQWAKAKMYGKQNPNSVPVKSATELHGPAKWRKTKSSSKSDKEEKQKQKEPKKERKLVKSKNKILAEATVDTQENKEIKQHEEDDEDEIKVVSHATSPKQKAKSAIKDEHENESDSSSASDQTSSEEESSEEEDEDIHDSHINKNTVADQNKTDENTSKLTMDNEINKEKRPEREYNENEDNDEILSKAKDEELFDYTGVDELDGFEDDTIQLNMLASETHALAGNENYRKKGPVDGKPENKMKHKKGKEQKTYQLPSISSSENMMLADDDLKYGAKKLKCHYRKSCYDTGIVPDIRAEQLLLLEHTVSKKELEFAESDQTRIQERCKYRKSCYTNGKAFNIKKSKTVKKGGLEISSQKPEQSRVPIQRISETQKKLNCLYRKSCYKTGKVPNLVASPPEITENHISQSRNIDVWKNQEPSQAQMKLKCQYRKSCYENNGDYEMPRPPISHKKGVKAPVQKTEPGTNTMTVVKEMAGNQKKLKCLYRKSCYKTGTVPSFKQDLSTEHQIKHKKEQQQEIKEAEHETNLKPKCKFQKACIEDLNSAKSIKEAHPTSYKPKKSLTNHEKDHKPKKQPNFNKVAAKKPSSKVVQVKELSESALKQTCKFRKSCYKTGVIPEIQPMKPQNVIKELPTQESQLLSTELKCKYRKSCYKTGVLPELFQEHIDAKASFQPTENDVTEKEQPIQLKCKFRKSCYETGRLPEIYKVQHTKPEAATVITQENKKLSCKYQKPCYQKLEKIKKDPKQMKNMKKQASAGLEDKTVLAEPTKTTIISSTANIKKQQKKYQKKVVTSLEKLTGLDTNDSPENMNSRAGETINLSSPPVHKSEEAENFEQDEQSSEFDSSKVKVRQNKHQTTALKENLLPDQDASTNKAKKGKDFIVETHGKIKAEKREIINEEYDNVGIEKRHQSQEEDTPAEKLVNKEQAKEIKERPTKLSCKFRRSCYETSKLPDLNFVAHEISQHTESDKKLKEIPIQLRCKFRRSCYETGILPDIKAMKQVVNGEPLQQKTKPANIEDNTIPIQLKCKFRKSCYDTGNFPELHQPVKQADELEHANGDKEDSVTVTEDLKSQQLKCKFRKSCYKTGIFPEIRQPVASVSSETAGMQVTVQEPQSLQIKCKFRKSCYETGILPELYSLKPSKATNDEQQSNHPDSTEKGIPDQIKCKFRKSCYTTGVLPDLLAKPLESEFVAEPKIDATVPMQLRCKYKRSCYEKTTEHAEEPIIEEGHQETKPKEVVVQEKKSGLQQLKDSELQKEEMKRFQKGKDVTNKETEAENAAKQINTERGSATKLQEDNDDDDDDDDATGEYGTQKQLEDAAKQINIERKSATKLQEDNNEDNDATGEYETRKQLKNAAKQINIERKSATKLQEDNDDGDDATEEYETRKQLEHNAMGDHEAIESTGIMEAALEDIIRIENEELQSEGFKKNQENYIETHQEEAVITVSENLEQSETNKKRENLVIPEEIPVPEQHDQATVAQWETQSKILPQVATPLKCKFRKSCYETGKLPDLKFEQAIISKSKTVQETAKITEIPIQLHCKFRKSCYKTGKLPDLKLTHDVAPKLTAEDQAEKIKETPIQVRCKFRKSCYETGELPDLKFAANVAPKLTTEEKIKQIKEIPIQLRCKFRKSCYETGDLPNLKFAAHVAPKLKTEERMEQIKEIPVQLRCKFRKSCYETGQLPDLKFVAQVVPRLSTEEKPEEKMDIPIQLRCKFRKSCYETGKLPKLKLAPNAGLSSITEPPKEIPLKVRCKFRKSCYEKDHLSEPELSFKPQQFEPLTDNELRKESSQPVEEPVSTDASDSAYATEQDEELAIEQDEELATEQDEELATEQDEELATEQDEEQPTVEFKAATVEKMNEPPTTTIGVTLLANDISDEARKENVEKTRTDKKQKQINTEGLREELLREDITKKNVDVSRTEEIKEIPIKLHCKFRKSCYETGLLPDLKFEHPVIKQTAEPRTQEKEIPIQMRCKFRKSCYETGVLPDIKSLKQVHTEPLDQKDVLGDTDASVKTVTEDAKSQQIKCKFRKSCYETGVLPKILNPVASVASGTDSTDLSPGELLQEPQSIQMKCKFRKSCYETGVLPEVLHPKPINKEASSLDHTKKEDIKMTCHYRKSCYEGHDNRENMQDSSEIPDDKPESLIMEQTGKETEAPKILLKPSLPLDQNENAEPENSMHWTEKRQDQTIPLPAHTNDSLKCNKWRISCRSSLGLPPKVPKYRDKNGKPKKLCRKKLPPDYKKRTPERPSGEPSGARIMSANQ